MARCQLGLRARSEHAQLQGKRAMQSARDGEEAHGSEIGEVMGDEAKRIIDQFRRHADRS